MGQEQRSRRRVKGKPYNVITIKKALFPLQSGVFSLPKRTLRVALPDRRARRVDPFGFPFQSLNDPFSLFGRTQMVTVESNSLSIKVLPLPVQVPPEVIVGALSRRISSKNAELRVGDDHTFSVKVTSNGNLSALNAIPLESPNKLQVFEETPETRFFENSGELFTEKTFTFSVVPTQAGSYSIVIPALEYFDPIYKKVRVAAPLSLDLTVRGGGRYIKLEQL